MARRNKTSASSQLDMFDRPAPKKAKSPKKTGATKKKTGAAGRPAKKGKRKRPLTQSEVRLYTSASGHRYELRRLS